jgi:hypothetical protein
VSNGGVVLSFALFEKTHIETYYTDLESCDGEVLANDLLAKIAHIEDAKLAITFADGLCVNGEVFLKSIKKRNKKLLLAGGMAGDNAQFQKTLVFTKDSGFKAKAVIVLLKNQDLVVGTHYSKSLAK